MKDENIVFAFFIGLMLYIGALICLCIYLKSPVPLLGLILVSGFKMSWGQKPCEKCGHIKGEIK